MEKHHICVVIPAFNEAQTIRRIVSDVIGYGLTVLVIDDASEDNTAELASSAGAIVLSNLKNLGAWKSTQLGMRYANRCGFDVVITMDADGQHKVSCIDKLLSEYNKGADVVVGNCTSRGSTGRHIAWSIFKSLNQFNIFDITSGFRLYSHKAIKGLISREATMLEYQCIGVLLLMRDMRLNIKEVYVEMTEREQGISRIFYSWTAVFYYLAYSMTLTIAKAFPLSNKSHSKYIERLHQSD
jgi:glycosyltransferase involved in cell wall biosynthesis